MPSLTDIQNAARLLHGKILRTPTIYSPTFSRLTGSNIYLKLENLQRGGSFKIRGATYKIQTHLDQIGPKGVIAASSGNHAQGVALAARDAGVPATIVMPNWVSITKQLATKQYDAELILKGQRLIESIETAREMAGSQGRMFIHPYDDPDLIIGQGTIGLEILEDLPDVDIIIVPIGGGGLISGIAASAKALRPGIKVIGVQAQACPSAFEARIQGKPVEVEEKQSIADAIMVTKVGEADFSAMQELVDDIVLVDEDQISAAMMALLERKKILAEGAGAVPLAALLCDTIQIPEGSRVVLVISGGNVDSLLLERIVRQGLLRDGRLMRFSVQLEDVPGSLLDLTHILAGQQANIVHIYHARNMRGLPINATRVELELETRGFDHISDITDALRKSGYMIELK